MPAVPLKEDLMINQFQESLMAADGAGKTTQAVRLGYVQAAIGLALVIVISAFGLFIASQALGQENMTPKTQAATANVLPILILSPELQEPNLNGMLATGDGGAMIETKGKNSQPGPNNR